MRTVGALMTSEVSTVGPDVPLLEAIGIMARRAISCVVVRDGPPPIGVVTERDLVRKLLAAGRDPATLRVGDVMTAPVHTVTQEASALEAFQLIRTRAFRRLPVVDEDGGLVGIVTQSDLLHAMIADIEEASRLKSDILAVISHELRTPIAVIAGYVELLMDGTFEPLTPRQQEVITNVQHASSQLIDLVNTAFELTQLEAGRATVTRRLIDMGMLLEELGDEFEARVPEGVSLDWRNELGTEPVLGDHAKIKTSLTSLVDNALKFTSAGRVAVTGHGDRDPGRGPANHLRHVPSGRRLEHAPLRGVRPRPARRQAPGRSAGRDDHGGQYTGCGQHFPDDGPGTPHDGWPARAPVSG